MKLGIISDTHITSNTNQNQILSLISQIKNAFKEVEKILHAGDVNELFFLKELESIAPVYAVKGDSDDIESLTHYTKISISRYNIGIIHELPEDLEEFMKADNLQILVFGHTHIPLIKGTPFNTLLLNPGSPIKPNAPPSKPGFLKPVARPTVITLNIDENDILSTFIITLKL
jgi:putative phosphoesterase